MASDGVVIDTDAHYREPALTEFVQYMDEDDPWRMRFEENPGRLLPSNTPHNYMFGRIQRDVSHPHGEMSPEEVQVAMDHLGVDKIIMLSQNALSTTMIGAQDRRPMVFAEVYLEYMLDQILDPDKGVYSAIPVPHQDPGEAAELIDEYGGEDGIVGVCLLTSGPEPPLGHRRYDRVYDAAESAELPVIFHAGGSSLDDFYIDGYERFIESHALGFLWSNMAQLTSIVCRGVPERYPDLDIVFQEAGISWVPAYMGRLDQSYLKRRAEVPLLSKRPSEYMKEFYYSTQPIETFGNMAYFEQTIEALGGADRLLYASDYPHWDYDPPASIEDIPFLSEEEKAKILGGNAREVFGI